jgi:hypothetical protein
MLPIVPLLVLVALAEVGSPDPAQLIRNAMAAGAVQDKKNEKFTFLEDEEREGEKKRTYDNIMLEGANYRKLILIDGKPLDAKTAKKVEEDLEKTRQQRKRHQVGFHKEIQDSTLDQVARLFDSKVTGEEVINGRKAWRVESEPKPGVKGANSQEEEVLATRRVTWFDEEDGVEARSRSTYFRNVHQIQAGNEMEAESSKIGDTWHITSFRFHANIKFFPGIGVKGDVLYRYREFKRFAVDTTFTPN